MQVHAVTTRKIKGQPTADGWDIKEVPSSSGNKVYRVDLTHGRCSCPAWIFQKSKVGETRAICKHLQALGFKQLIEADQLNFQEKPKTAEIAKKVKVSV